MEKARKIQIDNAFVVQINYRELVLEKSIIQIIKIISTLFSNGEMQCFARLF